jgi:hypothetical protein
VDRLLVLSNEIKNDPEGRGYSGMADDQARADDLNLKRKDSNRVSMSGSEVFTHIDDVEYAALLDPEKSQILALCAIDHLDPFGTGADVIVDIFGGGSATASALNAARVIQISRAQELGIGFILPSDIDRALTKYP